VRVFTVLGMTINCFIYKIHIKTCNNKELEKIIKLGTIARVAVGIVVIGTLWPIGLFGDD